MQQSEQTEYRRSGAVQALLTRAQHHVVSGRKRLSEGKTSLGIVTLYDAVNSAVQWFVSFPENLSLLRMTELDIMSDDSAAFSVLVRSGIIEGGFDYESLDKIVDMALKKDMSSYDSSSVLAMVESVMTSLGIMPFEEGDVLTEEP